MHIHDKNMKPKWTVSRCVRF